MIEKHQILIDGLVKIVESTPNKSSWDYPNKTQWQISNDHYKTIASDTLKTYMGANNLELDERGFLPGYHEYITAHMYDVRHGYLSIEYSIPKKNLKLPYAAILPQKYRYTHGVTSVSETETHLIIIIDML